ncbi:MAG: type II secretion system F family protein [Planctomycetota bacterium]|nr:type II secretion system F family protein [Planctomycetota bacterium]
MPTYLFEAMNSVGQPIKGEVEAATSEEAAAKVRSLGNFPTKIKEAAAKKKVRGGPAPEVGAGRRRSVSGVKRKHLTQFTRQLCTLIDAGLPIVRSLSILEQQQKPGPLRMAIRMVKEDVEAGTTLSEAMERCPKVFDTLYTSMVRAGELGGVLDVILQRLADFMEKAEALRRKVVSAMIYPMAVITFAILIVTGLLKFVVPKFVEVFSNMHAEMPGPTLFLMALSRWIEDAYGWVVVLGTPFAIWGGIKLLNRTKGGKMFIDTMKLRIPIVGQIVAKGTVSRFARTLGTLLEAGVPILEAIHITRNTCGNAVYAGAMEKVYEGIREGENFADPLRRSKVVDPMVINMIDVGEETGELDKMLVKVADTYDDEVQTLVSSMTALMEPVMVIVLGGIVGFIVVALFLPMVYLLKNLKSQ